MKSLSIDRLLFKLGSIGAFSLVWILGSIGSGRAVGSRPEAKVDFSPPNAEAPASTTGGASRGWGTCIEPDDNLVALMPPSNLGLTLEAHPTIWLYVPESSADTLELVLNREDGTEVLRKTTVMPQESGIISLTLNESDLPALEIGKDYRWYASILCSETDRSGNAIVEGWVKRIDDSTLRDKLARAEVENHLQLYAEAGIWYETLATLVHLRRTQPDNAEVLSSWEQLMQSVGLEAIADAPLSQLPR
ncbi:MAG: DUF928 domain-containing protein [Cyanobacteriota bacterium]|nr:DUF928 domain-containing protein [Cyanobacteriota bacterium]